MLALYFNIKRIGFCYWFTIGLILFSFSTLNAQEDLKEQLKQAQLDIYKNPQKAVERSADIYKKATDLDMKISTLITLVNGYTTLNDNETAMHYAVKAQNIAKESGNIHLQIRTLGLLGEQYQLYHLNSISREYLKKAENLLTSPSLTKEEVAVSKGNIYAVKGNSYKDQIDCEYAIENYNYAIAEYKTVPAHTGAQNNLALVYLEKGNCLLDLGDLKNAAFNFNSAKVIASTNGLLEYSNYAEFGLAKIDTEEKKFDAAIVRLLSLKNDEQLSIQSSMELRVFDLLKENYKQTNNLDAYLDMQEKYANSLAQLEDAENTNFEQVLSFINNTNFNQNTRSTFTSKLIYLLVSFIVLVFIYEASIQILRKKQLNETN